MICKGIEKVIRYGDIPLLIRYGNFYQIRHERTKGAHILCQGEINTVMFGKGRDGPRYRGKARSNIVSKLSGRRRIVGYDNRSDCLSAGTPEGVIVMPYCHSVSTRKHSPAFSTRAKFIRRFRYPNGITHSE